MRRRDLALGLLAGVAVTIAPACGGAPVTAPDSHAAGDKIGSVGTNHGHLATVTAAELQAGSALLLQIQGQSTHGHTLALTADEVRRIRLGERISQFSSDGFDDKHNHVVTFN
jgi:hypothetical protein